MADLKKKTGKDATGAGHEKAKTANKQSDKRKLEDKKSGQGTSKILKETNQLIGNKQDQGKGKGKDRPNKANQAASTLKIEKVKPGDKGNVVLKQSTKNANKGKGEDKPNKANQGEGKGKGKGKGKDKDKGKGKGKDRPNNKTNQAGASTTDGKHQTKAADHEGKTVDILEGVHDGLNLVTNILTGGLFPGFI